MALFYDAGTVAPDSKRVGLRWPRARLRSGPPVPRPAHDAAADGFRRKAAKVSASSGADRPSSVMSTCALYSSVVHAVAIVPVAAIVMLALIDPLAANDRRFYNDDPIAPRAEIAGRRRACRLGHRSRLRSQLQHCSRGRATRRRTCGRAASTRSTRCPTRAGSPTASCARRSRPTKRRAVR